MLRLNCNSVLLLFSLHGPQWEKLLALIACETDNCHSYMSHVMRKPDFRLCENKGADQLWSITAQLTSAFVFAARIVKLVFFLSMKFQVSCSDSKISLLLKYEISSF